MILPVEVAHFFLIDFLAAVNKAFRLGDKWFVLDQVEIFM